LAEVEKSLGTIGRSEARELTDKIKARSEELWDLLLEAYERKAHKALGYTSWGEYFGAEFGGGKSQAYRVLEAGRVVRVIADHSPIGERPTESQARELAPLAKEDPEAAAEAWSEALEKHGHDVTASDIREIVSTKTPPQALLAAGGEAKEWSDEERELLARLQSGETVVVNMHHYAHPNLVAWAKDAGLFVRIDRHTDWGDPFVLEEDGDRDTVVYNFEHLYLPSKPSLKKRRDELRGGKALGCWCAPARCHGDVLKIWAEAG
jgi:hypothetical protein